MKLKLLLSVSLIALSSSTYADEITAQKAFLKNVNQSFLANTFKGTWGGDCIVQKDGRSSFQTQYTFLEQNQLEISSKFYADTACYSNASQSNSVGKITLNGMKLNHSGQYIYDLLLENEQSTKHVYLSLSGTQTIQIYKALDVEADFSLNKKSH